MDNGQMPPVQPIAPSQPASGAPMMSPSGMPMIQQVQALPEPKKDVGGLIKTIVIIILALTTVAFIGLFVWIYMQYNEVSKDVADQISAAVTVAKDEQAQKDEADFLEREKYPLKGFVGPADYGELRFQYPKTWSVYVAKAATAGGDFNAYFNPDQVDAVAKDTINALRVTIRDKSFDDVTAEYQKYVDKKDATLTVTSTTIGKNDDIVANRYTGIIPSTDLNGFIVIFKIRDKTVILQTDSVLFENDFDALLKTVTFNA